MTLGSDNMLLTDFDRTKTSTFDPYEVQNVIPDFPRIAVTCFSRKLVSKFVEIYNPEIIAFYKNSNIENPIYKINYKGVDVAFYMSMVGASACVVGAEEIYAMGAETIIMFGSAGVLDRDIADLAIVIPNFALRDEGTSYHYLPDSAEVEVNIKYMEEFKNILKEHNCSYIEGKTWTTDAPYRETRDKVLKRKEAGCIAVEMECASMAAMSSFRNKEFFQFFYAADNLDAAKWDKRSLGSSQKLDEKSKVILLALELAKRISK